MEEALRLRPGLGRNRSGWLLAAAALILGVWPAVFTLQRIRENRLLQARGIQKAREVQKRLQAEQWAEFMARSLDLLDQFRKEPQFCNPGQEDRSRELQLASNLRDAGRLLDHDSLGLPEAPKVRRDLSNWLDEVTAMDGCMDPRRAEELLRMADRLRLEDKALEVRRKLMKVTAS